MFDIPIFTEEFLEYNKSNTRYFESVITRVSIFKLILNTIADRETELRLLRKNNTDLEQQNAILEKHLDNMKQAVDKLQIETLQRKTSNNLLQQHLQKMRNCFTETFSNISLPGKNIYKLLSAVCSILQFLFGVFPTGTNEAPNSSNIDQYVSKLHTLLQDNSNSTLYNKVKHAVSIMDLTF